MPKAFPRRRNEARPPEVIDIGGLEVRLSRKRVKNLSLYIKPPDGRIEITAPYHLPISDINGFVARKREWITKKQAQIASSPQSLAECATKEQIEEWRAVVKACTPPLVEVWEEAMGVKCTKLDFRNMKSRWGSCKPSTGRICINIRLALYPPECLEYVVVHELCHLLEGGHGPRFQALMDRFLPDWRQRRAKLR